MVILHEVVVNASLGECLGAIGFHEEAASIFVDLGLDDNYSRKRGLNDIHSGLV